MLTASEVDQQAVQKRLSATQTLVYSTFLLSLPAFSMQQSTSGQAFLLVSFSASQKVQKDKKETLIFLMHPTTRDADTSLFCFISDPYT
jgi:hypothetical protein